MPRHIPPILSLSRLDIPAHHDHLYTAVTNALSMCSSGPLILNMRHLPFLPADGVLALVGVARLWHRQTCERTILRNLQVPVHQYLERIDLFTRCGDWITADVALDPALCWERTPESSNLSELLSIESGNTLNSRDVALATARAKKILLAWIEQDEAAVNRLAVMLSELASNVAHSEDRGFAIMQRYATGNAGNVVSASGSSGSSGRPGSRVTLAIADLGIGIEASLRRQPHVLPPALRGRTGADYILHALELGVTSREDVAGTGLFQIRQWVQEWFGTLTIRSQRSRVTISPGAGAPHLENNLAFLPGTQVTLTVRRQAR